MAVLPSRAYRRGLLMKAHTVRLADPTKILSQKEITVVLAELHR
jgi:hypothetical protein